VTLLILALAWLGGLITAALGGGYLWPLALAAGFGLGLGLLI
jgi:hypothetical protein